MDEQFGCVSFGKAFNGTFFMFPNASHKIACDANVDGAVFLAGHDIDVTAHTLIRSVLDPRVKPEDDVGKGGALSIHNLFCTFSKRTPKPPTRQRARALGIYCDTRGEVRPAVIKKTETKIASCEQLLFAHNIVAPGCLPFYPLPRA